MGKGSGHICYTFLPLWHCSGEGFHCSVVSLLSIRGLACRGLLVKEWNHGVYLYTGLFNSSTGSVLSYSLFFLSANWILVGIPGPVSVIIIVVILHIRVVTSTLMVSVLLLILLVMYKGYNNNINDKLAIIGKS